MSYKDIPESFQPNQIINNRYYFDDGVYSIETDHGFQYISGSQNPDLDRVFSRVLVGNDDAASDPDPPNYLNGVRRVRNICADLEFVTGSSNAITIQWLFDIVVLRQGQTQAFSNDILATQSGIQRSSGYGVENEEARLCYPGYVDLNGGDTIIVRVSYHSNDTFWSNTSLSSACCVRFG